MSNQFPGFDKLHLFSDPFSKHFRGDFQYRKGYELTRGEITSLKTIKIKYSMGSITPSDIIWTTSVFPIIINHKIIEIFNENNITGWDTYKVSVIGKKGEVFEGYYGLIVNGRCGNYDYKNSELVYHEFPGGIYPHIKGIYFNEDSWDGSDIFMEKLNNNGGASGDIFITDRVKKALKKSKIKNVEFIKLSEYEINANTLRSTGNIELIPTPLIDMLKNGPNWT